MEVILGIDLGTTNSVACILRDGKPEPIRIDGESAILPSAVGLNADGEVIVGAPARNQALVAPQRTALSIKRKMGGDEGVMLGDESWSPQQVSAAILRVLKQRAEATLGHPISRAVITVPAFFNDKQRAATRQAGELAGLQVDRIINEPTAASLLYQPADDSRETILVYDLGGGTFDVSIVSLEAGVAEVLSSRGDTQLGGDDFDQALLQHVCERFAEDHPGIDLRATQPPKRGCCKPSRRPSAASRLNPPP